MPIKSSTKVYAIFFGLLWLIPACFAIFVYFDQDRMPELSSRVVDQAGIISPAAAIALADKLSNHEQQTSNQVVVATVNSLSDYPIESYATNLFRYWGLGQKNKNNGVLLLIAPNERKARIEVGYGLEGTLTDAMAMEIMETTIIPAFKEGDMEKGITSGTDAIITVLNAGPPATTITPASYHKYSREIIKDGPQPGDNWHQLMESFISIFFAPAFLTIMILLQRVLMAFGVNSSSDSSIGDYGSSSSHSSFSDSSSSSSSSSSDSFSGGGGDSGGGGASGSW